MNRNRKVGKHQTKRNKRTVIPTNTKLTCANPLSPYLPTIYPTTPKIAIASNIDEKPSIVRAVNSFALSDDVLLGFSLVPFDVVVDCVWWLWYCPSNPSSISLSLLPLPTLSCDILVSI